MDIGMSAQGLERTDVLKWHVCAADVRRMPMLRRARLAALLPFLLLVLLAAPSRAEAGLLVETSSRCEDQALEHPFLRWLDPAAYTLVPGGTFAGGPAWETSGGRVVSANEPWYVHGREPARAMALEGRAVATSPAMCVGLEHPTLRLFARNLGSPLDALQVEALVEDAAGTVQAVPIGAVLAGPGWGPTAHLPVVANLLPLLPGQHTPVAFRFSTTSDSSSWRIDAAFVDPYGK